MDLVYARLGEATRSAQQVASEGANLYKSDRGSFVREEDGTGLYERDVFAFQAAKRLAVLDAEHEGLVFGRLDRTDGEIRYVGRIGVRDVDYEPLVIDWRAPAAEPFYRATPVNPDGGRPSSGAALLGRPGDRHRGRPAGRGCRRGPRGGRRGRADGGAQPGSRTADARHRRHHPVRAGRGDPGAVAGLHDDLRRSRHGQDGRRPAPGGLPAVLAPPPVRERWGAGGRSQPGLHDLHRAGAPLARRGRRDAALDRCGRRRRGRAPR